MAIVSPDAQFTLLDSNSKKMMVVEDISKKLQLKNVKIHLGRAEDLNNKFDFMFGRAVASIPKFLGFSSHLLDDNSKVMPTGTSLGTVGMML